MEFVDDLNDLISVIEYLAHAEDKPGLSNILLSVSANLECVKDGILITTREISNEKEQLDAN